MNAAPPLFIALLILASAGTALALRNLIHSALLLIVSWFGIALFYLWAGAEFVAFAQVLIYVGAVSMVVLFAVLLTRRSRADLLRPPGSLRRAGPALLAGAAVAALLFWAVLRTPLEVSAGSMKMADEVQISASHSEVRNLPRRSSLSVSEDGPVRQIGALLMGPQAASLLVIGVILTVALIGAVVLAAPGVGKKDPP